MQQMWLIIGILFGGLLACSPNPYPGEEGSILHVALSSPPKSLDPAMSEDSYSNKVTSQIYEGLLAYHPYARPYQLVPALAAKMPEVSEDQMTYTFTLRDDVVFQDDPCFPEGKGRRVTGADFIFAFKRLAHPETKAKGWWIFDGKIQGMNEWRSKIASEIAQMRTEGKEVPELYGIDTPLSGIQHNDQNSELVIKLGPAGEGSHGVRMCNNNRDEDEDGLIDEEDPDCQRKPYPQLPWVLAMSYAAVYPKEAVEYYGQEFRNHPVGTGPFQMKEFNPVYRAVLERNPTYREVRVPDPVNNPEDRLEGWDWQADVDAGLLEYAGARVPQYSGMEMRFIQEDQPRWLYFKNGYLDSLSPPKDNMKEVVVQDGLSPEMEERGIQLSTVPQLDTVYTSFNVQDSVMDNVHLRRAMALAIDHSWIIDNLYAGQATMARSVIPPGVGGHISDYHPYHQDDGTVNLDRAKEEMVSAGYPNGLDPATGEPLRLVFQSSGSSATSIQHDSRFVDDMRQLGIEVDVVNNTFGQMLEKMDNGDYQIASLAWNFDYPDAQNILQMFYGPNIDVKLNSSFYRNAQFDALYEQATTLPDSPERNALYAEMSQMISDDVPWISRVHRIGQNLQHPWLTGFKYTSVNDHYWRYVHIDRAERDAAIETFNQPTRWPIFAFIVGIITVIGWGLRERKGAA